MTNKMYLVGALILAAVVYFGSCEMRGIEYYEPKAIATHFNGEHFVGSETCMECHADLYDSHLLTAHYNTSAIVNSNSIKSSFDSGSNFINLGEYKIELKKDGSSYYQQAKVTGTEEYSEAQKMDIVIGSGVKGQTFLTWEDDKLYQLQASYYPPTDSWINSPGYPNQLHKRPVRDGCLKCHVTFATNMDFSGRGNRYNKEKMIYGVDCEKCHRPAEKHVVFHRENPEVETAMYMLKLDTLDRQLRLDACAQCHSGLRGAIVKGNSFSYLVGERLDDYSRNFYTGQKSNELDVHGNQYGLLTSSACFINSPQMDCSTCHNPHTNQRGDAEYFNQKCFSCHNTETVVCSVETSHSNEMGNDCISCHMPTVQSNTMSVQLGSDQAELGVSIRTHHIGIYNSDSEVESRQVDSTAVNDIKSFIDMGK